MWRMIGTRTNCQINVPINKNAKQLWSVLTLSFKYLLFMDELSISFLLQCLSAENAELWWREHVRNWITFTRTTVFSTLPFIKGYFVLNITAGFKELIMQRVMLHK